MLTWLDAHAPAVQAFASIALLIASVVLAVLTARYVRLTKTIAESSVEEVRMLRESLVDARLRNRDSLRAHCQRLHASISVLHDTGPDHRQLHDYALVTERDIAHLESLANEHGAGAQAKASRAAIAIRFLLGWQARAAKTAPIIGLTPTPQDITDYVRARDDALTLLAAIAADIAAGSEHAG